MFSIVATHAAMDVANLVETIQYLVSVCGLQELREVNRPGVRVAWFPGLELRQANPEAMPGIVGHVAWQVDDVDEAVRVLKEKGVTFETDAPRQIDVNVVSTKEVLRYIFFTTPVGLRGELYEVKQPK